MGVTDDRIRTSAEFGRRMREQKCTTPGHEDRHAGWLIPRDDGQGDRWVCNECRYVADCTRVYSRGGRVAHLLRPGIKLALCLREPFWVGWYGTGSQDEYEKAAKLPLCKSCKRYAGV